MKFVLLKLRTIANFFLLNIAEHHESFSANKYENAGEKSRGNFMLS